MSIGVTTAAVAGVVAVTVAAIVSVVAATAVVFQRLLLAAIDVLSRIDQPLASFKCRWAAYCAVVAESFALDFAFVDTANIVAINDAEYVLVGDDFMIAKICFY